MSDDRQSQSHADEQLQGAIGRYMELIDHGQRPDEARDQVLHAAEFAADVTVPAFNEELVVQLAEKYEDFRNDGRVPQDALQAIKTQCPADLDDELRSACEQAEARWRNFRGLLPTGPDAQPGDAGATMLPPEIPGYRIEKELGRGGMGIVYKAIHLSANRIVALKVMNYRHHTYEEDRERFRREVEAMAQMKHPNILVLYDSDEYRGESYFSMEFCPRGSLANELKAGPLPIQTAAKYVELLARAMHYAHTPTEQRKAVYHRDLKPANILLGEDGVLKITDFGLARYAGLQNEKTKTPLTMPGSALGTPSYAAPEQLRDRIGDIGPWTDVYGLGAILYEMLTGRPPFKATPDLEVVEQVVDMDKEPERPSKLRMKLSRDLEILCQKCLAKAPEERFTSAEDLADELARFRAGEAIKTRPRPWWVNLSRWIRKRSLFQKSVAAAVVLLGIVASSAIHWGLAAHQEALDKTRAADLVGAVREAKLEDVASLVTDLSHLRQWAEPLLEDASVQTGLQDEEQVNVALALLILEGSQASDAQAAMLCERILQPQSRPQDVELLRAVLLPYKDRFREGLWQLLEDPKAKLARRFRAACTLALFDRDNRRWGAVAREAAEGLVRENSLQAGEWVSLLRPVGPSLVDPLGQMFRASDNPTERRLAAEILADYAADEPDILTGLLLDADEVQFACLWPALQLHRNQAISIFNHVLQEQIRPAWQDPPLSWKPPPAELVAIVDNAGGLVADRFALCQTMSLDQFLTVADKLNEFGYRPIRVRPYRFEDSTKIAAVWARDGRRWCMLPTVSTANASAEEVRKRDDAEQRKGGDDWQERSLPVDAACYLAPSPEGDLREYYAAVWAAPANPEEVSRLDIGAPRNGETTGSGQTLRANGFVPLTIQVVRGVDGSVRCSSVWCKTNPRPSDFRIDSGRVEPAYISSLREFNLQTDVCPWRANVYVEAETWYKSQLAQATERLRSKPDDWKDRLLRAEALFHLGNDAEAIRGFSDFLAQPLESTQQYWNAATALRAQAYARLGKAEEAGKDLAAYQIHNAKSNTGGRAFLEAVVAAYLQEDADGMRRLEAGIKEHGEDSEFLYQAARAYAAGARAVVKNHPNGSRQYVDRAAELIAKVLASDQNYYGKIQIDMDLEEVRSHPLVAGLLASANLGWRYAAVLWRREAWVSKELHGLVPEEHLARCRDFAAEGLRPAAISIVWTGKGAPIASSVWHLPVPESAKDALAKKQARAAVALLRLGKSEQVWPLLQYDPERPAQALSDQERLQREMNLRVRTYLLHFLGPLGADPMALVTRLEKETSDSARRALILALGEFDEERLAPEEQNKLADKIADWYRDDPDAGFHSALEWLRRRGKFAGRLEKFNPTAPLPGAVPDPHWYATGPVLGARTVALLGSTAGQGPFLAAAALIPGRTWYMNQSGQTFAVVPAFKQVLMGSPRFEPGWMAIEEQRARLITHSYAISTKEVTVGQYLKFFPGEWSGHNQTSDLDAPAVHLSWYDAILYCRLLSEQEGVPKEQMCYPSKEEIQAARIGKAPLELDKDYLSRTGYRLPTEAEWEYACRAGADTPRFFGVFEEPILEKYAWFARNSGGRTRPVGLLKPNDLGLFDVYGNVLEWCQDPWSVDPTGTITQPVADSGGDLKIAFGQLRILRGGMYDTSGLEVRSAARWNSAPSSGPESGLRLARTCR